MKKKMKKKVIEEFIVCVGSLINLFIFVGEIYDWMLYV